ncbi:MAG: sigma-70 family RNA polymerase sigma factor [Spirochaetes bacterium]|nr:sigma-70 family RNA polymerase sigma factor [Spirochaetota bacterium]
MPDKGEIIKLLEKCLKKDDKAWEELYYTYCKLVYSWIHHAIRQKNFYPDDLQNEIEDIFCSVWEKVYSKLDTLNDLNKFPGWLKSVTVHTIYDRIRRKKSGVSLDDNVTENGKTRHNLVASDTDLENDILKKEELEELRKAMDALSEEEKFILIQHYFMNVKLEDIARILNKPIGTVGSLESRARDKLKKVMKHE